MTDDKLFLGDAEFKFEPSSENLYFIGSQQMVIDQSEYVIDFDKLKTFEEVIAALKAANFRFYSPQMSGYGWLMPWLKKVED